MGHRGLPPELAVHVDNLVELPSPETTPGGRVYGFGVQPLLQRALERRLAGEREYQRATRTRRGARGGPAIIDEIHGFETPTEWGSTERGPALAESGRAWFAQDALVVWNAELRARLAEAAESIALFGEHFATHRLDQTIQAEPEPDPMARALELRRNRNTGPQRRQRAPRDLTPRRPR